MKIPEKLLEARKNAGLTQKKLAEEAGLTERVYQRYELGETLPRLNALVVIADVLGVSLDYLVGRVDDPNGGYRPPGKDVP